ncbi:MAG: hypothetical protein NUV53_00880 [Patescibacteria group bacterium]|nr:hypothetical protein [Patescibacteria group bacterium]
MENETQNNVIKQNTWVIIGVAVFIVIVAGVSLRSFFNRPQEETIPGLTAGQVATLNALAARAEAKKVHAGKLPTLTQSQSQTLNDLSN